MMRDHVSMVLNGKEFALLPTFGVLDQFEAKHGPLPAHFAAMMGLTATLRARAYLVFLGIKAAHEAGIGEMKFRGDLAFPAVAESMFENGVLNEAMGNVEVDFMERLLYAPAEYLEKKAARAKAKEELARLEAGSLLGSDSLAAI